MNKDINYEIIDNISYTKDDIKELIGTDVKNNSYSSVGTTIMFLSACTIFAAETPKNLNPVLDNNNIEIVNTNFQLEEYQANLTFMQDYQMSEFNNFTNEIRDCIGEILSFKSLQESWDGYGALPLQIKSATNAIDFLDAYEKKSNFVKPSELFPNPTGTISLIWENNDEERISVEIGNHQISYYIKLNNNLSPGFYNNIQITKFNVEDITRKINSLF